MKTASNFKMDHSVSSSHNFYNAYTPTSVTSTLQSRIQVEVDLEQAGVGTGHSKRNEYMLSPVPVRYVKMECRYSSNKNQDFATHTVQTSHIRDVEDSYAEIPHISASLLL